MKKHTHRLPLKFGISVEYTMNPMVCHQRIELLSLSPFTTEWACISSAFRTSIESVNVKFNDSGPECSTLTLRREAAEYCSGARKTCNVSGIESNTVKIFGASVPILVNASAGASTHS